MQELHDMLDWCLVRAGHCSVMSSGRSQSRGRAHFHAPTVVPSLSQAQSLSPKASRYECTAATKQHGHSTAHPSQTQSTDPVQSLVNLCAPQRADKQTPTHSPLRHEHNIPPASSEATSVSWEDPWMRCFHSTHRCSYSRGRQQQWSQSLPQRGPLLSEAHSWTPSRSLSRPPCSQLRDKWQHHSSSCPQWQPHQQESLGKELVWPSTNSHCRNQLKYAHPRVPHRSRCSLTSSARMILSILCNC